MSDDRKPDGWDPNVRRGFSIPFSSGRFWATFLGYLVCFAVPLFIQNAGNGVWVLTIGLLVLGVVGARINLRDDPPVAAGLGCGVVVALVSTLALLGLFVLWINFGTLP